MVTLVNRVQVGTLISTDQHKKLEEHCELTGQKKSRVIESAINLFLNLDNKEILQPENVVFQKLSTSFDENQFKQVQKYIKEKEQEENKSIKMYLVLYSALEAYLAKYGKN